MPDEIDFKKGYNRRTDKEEPSNSTSGYLSEETQKTKPKKLNQKDIYIHIFTAALFTIAKIT